MKTNISNTHNCFGCGVCAASCPKKLISIQLNRDGFYEPRLVDEDSCTHCGICTDVCAFSHSELASNDAVPVKSWAAWSNEEGVRNRCSSGGIGFEIGKQLIEQGYHAVGCRYDTKEQRAEHYIATTVDEFTASVGSKYIQSYTAEAFSQIKKKGQKYLVTGTPCQIDSFRRMIRKFHCEENFILLDFFCHCVPTMYAWKAYMKMLEPKIGKITYASWRNKFDYGWHDNWLMGVDGEKTAQPIDWHDSYNFFIVGEAVRKAPVQPIQPLSECCGRPIVSEKTDFSDGLGGVLAYSPGCHKETCSINSFLATSRLVPNAKPSANTSMRKVVRISA